MRGNLRFCAIAVALGFTACGSPSSNGNGGDGGAPPADAPTVGTPSTLTFAIVDDTRPPNPDDTASYPTAIITKIWSDVAAESPAPSFAVSTGDYMFASTSGNEQGPQLDLYLGARAHFTGPVYAAMGNHECTGATDSNCGPGTTDGVTKNYAAYLSRMVQPLGFSQPYYAVDIKDPGGAWTAKIVIVAANAWSTDQATWLDGELAKPTTYTFVVRHESDSTSGTPGVAPSKAIIAKHPLTLLIVGHTHTYSHYSSEHQVIVGNGGAPLTSGTNYGYGIVERRADGAIQFTAYDYQTHAVLGTWAIKADGSPTT